MSLVVGGCCVIYINKELEGEFEFYLYMRRMIILVEVRMWSLVERLGWEISLGVYLFNGCSLNYRSVFLEEVERKERGMFGVDFGGVWVWVIGF